MKRLSKVLLLTSVLCLACHVMLSSADFQQLLNTAKSFYKKGDNLNAFQVYQQALNMNPDSWEANMGVGNALYKMGRRRTALSYYRRSLELNPDNSELRDFIKKVEDQLAGREEKKGVLSGGGIKWLDKYNSGMEEANRERKFMMLLFYTEFNAGLPLLERKVFADKRVQEMAKKFVCVRIDGNVQRMVTRMYRVGGYPTIIFADGQENEKVSGMSIREAEELLKMMEKALKKKGKWRERYGEGIQ